MRPGFIALALLVVAHAVLTLSGLAVRSSSTALASDLVLLATGLFAGALAAQRARRIRAERAAWWCLAVALIVFSTGSVAMTFIAFGQDTPKPIVWDGGLWLFVYVPALLGFTLLVRARLGSVPRAVALDGVLSGLGSAAVIAGLVLRPMLATKAGDEMPSILDLSYPAGDVGIFALCAATLALTRGRPGRAWTVLLVGLAVFAASDTTYLFQIASGRYVDGERLDLLWTIGLAGIGMAAWQTPRIATTAYARTRVEHLVPALFSTVAIALLADGALGGRLPVGAVVLAVTTVLVTALRIWLVVRDIHSLAESRRLAESDDLTGLLNRRGLGLRLELALVDVREGSGLSLLLLDLNRFKEINDTLGHHAGDQLLEQVARRLQACLPVSATLARLGGDEFVALLGCGPAEAIVQAERMRAALARPVELDGLTTHTQASIGIACAPEHGRRRGDLLRLADVAMYRAKQRDTGIELYAADDDRNSRERLGLVAELRVALRDPDQLLLHYQPQVDMDTGRVTSVEALARWQHPTHGLLTPDRFLELAEQHALMHELTLAVLDAALQQQRRWRSAGITLDVAVNVSGADLLDAEFPGQVAARLDENDTLKGALTLELTERTVMREPGRALETLARLSELGVGLSLDDFGTGYSSLAHLKRLPVRELKVDRSFVMDMEADRDDAVIVRSTVELGRSLGLRVVAEGVETLEQLEQLTYFGCHRAQGFLISRPLPADEVQGWLLDHQMREVVAQPRPEPDGGPASHGAALLAPLLELAGLIADGEEHAVILRTLRSELERFVPHDDLVVYALDEHGETLSGLFAEGRAPVETLGERFPATEGIAGRVLAESRTRNLARSDLDPDSVQVEGTSAENEALVCCELAYRGRQIGVMNVYRVGNWVPFSGQEAATIERFAALASLALRRTPVAAAEAPAVAVR